MKTRLIGLVTLLFMIAAFLCGTGLASGAELIVAREGDTFALPALAEGAHYESADPESVTVHPSGDPCHARAPGLTSIIALRGEDEAPASVTRVLVLPQSAAIVLENGPLNVGKGGTLKIYPAWEGFDPTPYEHHLALSAEVADENVARLEDDTLIGIAYGNTELILRGSGSLVEARFPVSVIMREPCTRLSATIPYRLSVGESYTISAFPAPRDTTDEVRYVSASPAIASVSRDGTLTAHAAGKATVYVLCGEQSIVQVVYVRE